MFDAPPVKKIKLVKNLLKTSYWLNLMGIPTFIVSLRHPLKYWMRQYHKLWQVHKMRKIGGPHKNKWYVSYNLKSRYVLYLDLASPSLWWVANFKSQRTFGKRVLQQFCVSNVLFFGFRMYYSCTHCKGLFLFKVSLFAKMASGTICANKIGKIFHIGIWELVCFLTWYF